MAPRCLFSRFQFVDPDDNTDVWFDFLEFGDIGEDFDPGVPVIVRNSLSQEGVDGFVPTSSSLGEAAMIVPWIPLPSTDWDTMRIAYEAMVAECDKDTNVLEFRYTTDAASYLADTLRTVPPSLSAAPAPAPPHSGLRLAPLVVVIPHMGNLRGLGSRV